LDLDANGDLLGVEVLGISAEPDGTGYQHVDVAFASGIGRVVELDPTQMKDDDAPPKSKPGAVRTG
jgi:hypothetical protein